MTQTTSKTTFLNLATNAKRVAVFREISIPHLTFMDIAENLQDELADGTILESAVAHGTLGQYSLITFGTIAQLKARPNHPVTVRIDQEMTTHTKHAFDVLRELITELSCVGLPRAPEFASGAVGFLTYDAIRLFEDIPDRHDNMDAFPDVLFNFYRTVLMLDHHRQTLFVSILTETSGDAAANYNEAQAAIEQLLQKINRKAHKASEGSALRSGDNEIHLDIKDSEFIQLIEKAQTHIIAGDAFQIVLSRRFSTAYSASPFQIYQSLRKVSPAPYMFYLPFENQVILGASPEKMISVREGEVAINPIAGTRPRDSKKTTQAIEQELLEDGKERAEHMMLVDLARNDLGAVCQPKTINISELLSVKHYSHVSHITSMVTGTLRQDKDALDALAAAFPAGTLSGAPKIRAMEIIDELETSRRGMYGGAICRIDYQGNLDSCIAIRMAVLKDGVAVVRTGAGVVYDSNPHAEANETRQKAQSMLEAIALAEKQLRKNRSYYGPDLNHR